MCALSFKSREGVIERQTKLASSTICKTESTWSLQRGKESEEKRKTPSAAQLHRQAQCNDRLLYSRTKLHPQMKSISSGSSDKTTLRPPDDPTMEAPPSANSDCEMSRAAKGARRLEQMAGEKGRRRVEESSHMPKTFLILQ